MDDYDDHMFSSNGGERIGDDYSNIDEEELEEELGRVDSAIPSENMDSDEAYNEISSIHMSP